MNQISSVSDSWPPLSYLVMTLWVLFWQGMSLWKSAQYKQRNWFVVLLVISGLTFGILPIVYLFGFAKTKMKISELKIWEAK